MFSSSIFPTQQFRWLRFIIFNGCFLRCSLPNNSYKTSVICQRHGMACHECQMCLLQRCLLQQWGCLKLQQDNKSDWKDAQDRQVPLRLRPTGAAPYKTYTINEVGSVWIVHRVYHACHLSMYTAYEICTTYTKYTSHTMYTCWALYAKYTLYTIWTKNIRQHPMPQCTSVCIQMHPNALVMCPHAAACIPTSLFVVSRITNTNTL